MTTIVHRLQPNAAKGRFRYNSERILVLYVTYLHLVWFICNKKLFIYLHNIKIKELLNQTNLKYVVLLL